MRFVSYLLATLLSLFCFAQSELFTINAERGLASNDVFDVHQSADNRIWMCTDKGISVYNGTNVKNYTQSDGLSYSTFFKIFEAPNHDLWFTAYNGTITIFDYSEKRFKPFSKNKELLTYIKVGNMTYNWVQMIGFTEEEVYFIPRKVHKDIKIPFCDLRGNEPLSSTTIDDILSYEIEFKNVDVLGLHRVDKEKYLYNSTLLFTDVKIPIYQKLKYENWLQNLTLDYNYYPHLTFHNNHLFLCLRDDIIKVDSNLTEHDFLNSNSTSSIYFDNEGLIWISFVGKGVKVYASHHLPYFSSEDINTPLFDLLYCKDDSLILSTWGSVYLFNNREIKLTDLQRISIDSNFVLEHTFGKLNLIEKSKLLNFESFNPSFTSELKNSQIINYCKNSLRFNLISSITNSTGRYQTYASYYSSKDELYLSGVHGFQKFTFDSRIIDLNNTLGISSTILDIEEVGSMIILATSDRGILIIENDQLIDASFLNTDLISNIASSLYYDRDNKRMWCATNKGISVYEVVNDGRRFIHLFNLTNSEGLKGNTCKKINGNGKQVALMFDYGFQVLAADTIIKQAKPPTFIYLDAQLYNKTLKLDNNANLLFNENNIQFGFKAISMKPMEKFYRYRLIYEKDTTSWQSTSESNIVLFNLNSGHYCFQVSARSLNSPWSVPISYTYSIKERWYNRWWGRLIWILTLIGITFLLSRAYYLNWKRYQINALQLENTTLTNNTLQLNALRSQMNPHFIFNVFNSVQHMILSLRPEEASELLSSFAKLFRTILNFSRLEFVSVKENINFLEHYLSIEKQRHKKRFNYSITTQGFDEETTYIPPLFIQPLIENAIKYAFVSNQGELQIKFHKHNTDIKVEVIDNGKGFKVSEIRNSSHGLKIIQERIDIMIKNGWNASFDIDTSRGGTKVILILPCYEKV